MSLKDLVREYAGELENLKREIQALEKRYQALLKLASRMTSEVCRCPATAIYKGLEVRCRLCVNHEGTHYAKGIWGSYQWEDPELCRKAETKPKPPTREQEYLTRR